MEGVRLRKRIVNQVLFPRQGSIGRRCLLLPPVEPKAVGYTQYQVVATVAVQVALRGWGRWRVVSSQDGKSKV